MDNTIYKAPAHPEESYSRKLDESVCKQEYPYGYDNTPPSAGHENPSAKKQQKARK